MTFPASASDASRTGPTENGSVNAQSLKEMIQALFSADATALTGTLRAHTHLSAKKLFRSMDSSLASDAKKAAKHLQKHFPLRRYAVTTDATNRTDSICGTVILREGLPVLSKVSVSQLEFSEEEGSIAEYNMYMIVSSLPFKARACMFWNMTGVSDGLGISSAVLYHGRSLENLKRGVSVSVQGQNMISEKVRDLF
jgi:hypothetical protein